MNNKKWSFLGILLIVLGFAGMAYQQFDFGETLPSHQQKWTFDPGGLKALAIDSDYDVDVEFIDSPDGSNYVEISGNMKQETIDRLKQTELSGNTLQLNLKEDFDWNFFSINFQSTRQQITVALADRSPLEQISSKSRGSNGEFSGLNAAKIDLSVSSGNLRADSVVADQLSLAATSGNITAEKIRGNTKIKLTSGNIKVEELQGTLNAKSTSGNITAKKVEGPADAAVSSGHIRFEDYTGAGVFQTTSGNVTLSDQRSDSLDISVRSGNVTLSADEQFKGFYDLQTGSGNITSPDSPRQTQDLIKVRTTSGDIRIR
ncbi:DUF4097 family beta strand repeat-containing protein [Paenibacillus macerans]|uniref:DUF4097 family beta strand repeat-containing protein n=1 Tax=Paenibacillus macerans TaxID=44252 RepID=UPI003D3117E8